MQSKVILFYFTTPITVHHIMYFSQEILLLIIGNIYVFYQKYLEPKKMLKRDFEILIYS